MRHYHDALRVHCMCIACALHVDCMCIAWQVSVALQPFLLAVRLVSQPAFSDEEGELGA